MTKKSWRRLPPSEIFSSPPTSPNSIPTRPPVARMHSRSDTPKDDDDDIPTDTDLPDDTAPPLRTMNLNAYGSQQAGSRQTPRLQNTQKTGLGNGLGGAGWGMGLPGGGFGAPASSGSAAVGGPQPRLSGFAQVMGGGSGQGPIDMSDFPTLSGGPRPQENANQGLNWNSSSVRGPPATTQAQQNQQSQQRAPSTAPSQQSLDQFDSHREVAANERENTGEEFPPLGGQLNGDTRQHYSTFASSPDSTLPRTSGPPTQLPIREPGNTFRSAQQAPIGSGQPHNSQQPQQPQGSQQRSQSSPTQGPGMKRYVDMTETEKYGMLSLEAVLHARKNIEAGMPFDTTLPAAELNGVMMGQGVNTLGLDLDSPDSLLPTFTPFPNPVGSASQFNYHDQYMVPDYTLPAAYTVTNVPPISNRISAMSDETLFMMFFILPGDVDQELAALELSAREWRWHKVLRQWLQKDLPSTTTQYSALIDLATNIPVGTPPVRVAERVEEGVYVFFDPTNWRRERRKFQLDYDQLDFRQGVQQPAQGVSVSQQGNGAQVGPPGMIGSGGVGTVGGPVGGGGSAGSGQQQSGNAQIQSL